jgi:hypothetical protein
MSFIAHATLLLALAMTQAHSVRRLLPLDVPCDGNHLTIYAGRVVKLARHTGRTVVSIRTDEATIESVVLKHPGTNDPTPFFRIAGAVFRARDWPRIVSSPGHVRNGQRAEAWVCDNGDRLVDWKIPRAARVDDGVRSTERVYR